MKNKKTLNLLTLRFHREDYENEWTIQTIKAKKYIAIVSTVNALGINVIFITDLVFVSEHWKNVVRWLSFVL